MLYFVLEKISNWLMLLPHKLRYRNYVKSVKNFRISSGMNFFNGDSIYIYGPGELDVGNNSYIGSRGGIYIAKDCKCKIGSKTAISHNVRIYTGNRDPKDIISISKTVKEITGSVMIGDNCWIGANVFINQGVTIGNNCVIGANSVVTKDIPSSSIAVGAPIKIINNKM